MRKVVYIGVLLITLMLGTAEAAPRLWNRSDSKHYIPNRIFRVRVAPPWMTSTFQGDIVVSKNVSIIGVTDDINDKSTVWNQSNNRFIVYACNRAKIRDGYLIIDILVTGNDPAVVEIGNPLGATSNAEAIPMKDFKATFYSVKEIL